MARLLGVEIPNEKRIEASLSYIYGIGSMTAKKVLEQAGVDVDIRTGELSDEQISKIAHVITESETLTFEGGKLLIEGDLRREGLPHTPHTRTARGRSSVVYPRRRESRP